MAKYADYIRQSKNVWEEFLTGNKFSKKKAELEE